MIVHMRFIGSCPELLGSSPPEPVEENYGCGNQDHNIARYCHDAKLAVRDKVRKVLGKAAVTAGSRMGCSCDEPCIARVGKVVEVGIGTRCGYRMARAYR